VPTLTPAHDAVLAILDWLPVETLADAALVAALLAMPEADAAWLLDDLEEAGWASPARPGPSQ
jgi:DNA-binding IclR family transcriptional regulator